MTQRQDTTLTDKDGRPLTVTVSEEFGLVRIESDFRDQITMTLPEFKLLSEWVLGKRKWP